MSAVQRIAVIGARRQNQGTGGYIAAAFAQQGCHITAILGTRRETLDQACANLAAHDIRPNPYLDFAELLAKETPDLVVIASPHATHLEYLEQSITAGCHVFCEKPICAATNDKELQDMLQRMAEVLDHCAKHRLHIHINQQWPYTLTSFKTLYPKVSMDAAEIQSFAMELSPQSEGIDMVIDSAPHFLSMLYALLGSGKLADINIALDQQSCDLSLHYQHSAGETHARLQLAHHDQQPKPAAYAINGCRMQRHVDMADYSFSFSSAKQRIASQDPLQLSVSQCLKTVNHHLENAVPSDKIIDSIKHLAELISANG